MSSQPVLLLDVFMTLVFPALPDEHRDDEDVIRTQDRFIYNQELLEILEQKSDYDHNFILTASNLQHMPDVQKQIAPLFAQIFSVTEIGIVKSNPAAYQHVAQEINVPCENITFIDDSQTNICAAKEAGLNTIHFTTNQVVIPQLLKMLGKSS